MKYNKIGKKNKNAMIKLGIYVSRHHAKRLKDISLKKKIPITRLVSFLIDDELGEDDCFGFDFECKHFQEDINENLYDDEVEKITKYIGDMRKHAGLDTLYLLRHDMGIQDRTLFLRAFHLCLKREIIFPYRPITKKQQKLNVKDYKLYCLSIQKNRATKEYYNFIKMEDRYGHIASI